MAAALAEFRLEEVPPSILPFSTDFTNIFMTVWPQVYLEDLTSPSLKLYDRLTEAYLSGNFKRKKVKV